jgi:hypothetical protein
VFKFCEYFDLFSNSLTTMNFYESIDTECNLQAEWCEELIKL